MLYHTDRHEILKLKKPKIEKDNIIGFNTGVRPYRNNGIRIELEKIKNIKVIHNYGHGGAGVSLCFGSCKQSIECFENYINKNNLQPKKISVIGSGYLIFFSKNVNQF